MGSRERAGAAREEAQRRRTAKERILGRVPCQDWDRPDGERRGVTATRTNNPSALARAPKDIFFAHFFNGAVVPRAGTGILGA